MLLSLRANADLRRLGGDRWRSVGADPWLRLRRAPGGPRFAVIEITAEDGPLEGAVYVPGPAGFSEETRLDLPPVRRLLLVAHLAGDAARGLRLDPASAPGPGFALRWWSRRGKAGLARLLRRRLAAAPGLAPVLVGPDLGPVQAAPRLSRLLRRESLADRLVLVWEMAEAEARASPLPAVERPVISFLTPVFNALPAWLDALRDSVAAQGPAAELVLSDDGSTRPETRAWLDAAAGPGVTVLRSAANRGIAAATNAALAAARGDWAGLLDHDDVLSPYAVDRIRRALTAAPTAAFLYTDEAVIDGQGRPIGVFCKPAFDPVLLSGVNYVNHLSLYRRDRLEALGGLRDGFQGSQDYELVLRYCAGLTAEEIVHLPYPAYQWREQPSSLSRAGRDAALAAARRALELHYARLLGPVAAEPSPARPDLHRLRPLRPPRPAVSVVIPNRNSFELIAQALEDVFERTDYPDLETIVVDNGSEDRRVFALYERWTAARGLRVDLRPEPFNFARMINRGAAMARGEAILMLNNDVSALDPGWLAEMVDCLAYPGTGVVGAKLLYPDRSVQHAGVILGLGGYAGHWFYKARDDEPGPMGRLAARNGMTVVTGACLLATRACWSAVGGMDEARFAVAYNDVDFCARAREAGFRVVWTPHATLLHHESASRGSDLIGEKAQRFAREKAALAERHGTAAFEDPCFSPWYDRRRSWPDFSPPAVLPGPRRFLDLGCGSA